MSFHASGRELSCEAGDYSLSVVTVGAGISSLKWKGRNLVLPHKVTEVAPGWSGKMLLPWPNRIADGRYSWNDREYLLPINDRGTGTALHGLAGWLPWEIVDAPASHVRLESFIAAQESYPWPLTVRLDLRLDPESGLNIELSAKNLGDSPAPYGASLHPYLLGGTTANDSILSLPASHIVDTDENLLPTGINPVSTAYDFRIPRMVDDLFIDHCYGGLQGNWEVRVTNAQGEGAALVSNTPWVQIHTADALGRLGIAVEPMTCPPDAFNSGIDLVSLAPGQRHRLSLSIRGL